jgi:hypothetical protein
VLALVISDDPAMVPTTMPSIMSHNLLISETKSGPVKSCQKLVTKDGMIKSDAALTGDMTTPRIPMATVGNPIPVTPLTPPAKKKVNAMIRTVGEK